MLTFDVIDLTNILERKMFWIDDPQGAKALYEMIIS